VTTPGIQLLHAESVRIGVRLAAQVFAGQRYPEDKVAAVLRALPAQYKAAEFPLETLTSAYKARTEHRRNCAQRNLEVLLHHAGDPAYITDEAAKSMVGRAWMMAREMEDQEVGQNALDQLTNPNPSP